LALAGDNRKKERKPMTDKDLNLDLEVEPLDLDVEPLDLEVDFPPELFDLDALSLDAEPISPEESASIADQEAAIQAVLARATPAQLASARKAVDYLQRKH
jgi:hypothetical protein